MSGLRQLVQHLPGFCSEPITETSLNTTVDTFVGFSIFGPKVHVSSQYFIWVWNFYYIADPLQFPFWTLRLRRLKGELFAVHGPEPDSLCTCSKQDN